MDNLYNFTRGTVGRGPGLGATPETPKDSGTTNLLIGAAAGGVAGAVVAGPVGAVVGAAGGALLGSILGGKKKTAPTEPGPVQPELPTNATLGMAALSAFSNPKSATVLQTATEEFVKAGLQTQGLQDFSTAYNTATEFNPVAMGQYDSAVASMQPATVLGFIGPLAAAGQNTLAGALGLIYRAFSEGMTQGVVDAAVSIAQRPASEWGRPESEMGKAGPYAGTRWWLTNVV